MSFSHTCSVLIFIGLLAGCAQLQQNWTEQYCNQQAAYSEGVNDARHDKDMQPNYAAMCPTSQNELNQAYRQGYQFALAHQPVNININTSNKHKQYRCHEQFGEKVCGYDCKSFAGQWTCAQKPDQSCIQNMSDIQCGYHCQKDDFGKINCQTHP